MLDVSLSQKFEAGLSLNLIKKYKLLCVHSVIYIFTKSNFCLDSCKIMRISSHLVCCIDFNFLQEFYGTIP